MGTGMSGHNFDHGKGDICKKCGKVHIHGFQGKTWEEVAGKEKARILKQKFSEAGKKGGMIRVQQLRESGKLLGFVSKIGKKAHQILPTHSIDNIRKRRRKGHLWLNGISFDSKLEMELAQTLLKVGLLKELTEGRNCHVRVGTKEFDFLIEPNLFVEFHPWDYDISDSEYYSERRETLDENGYSDYLLLVVTNFSNNSLQGFSQDSVSSSVDGLKKVELSKWFG